ncbi:MAG: lytic murein transglycosylase [Nocardioides sp.]
MPASWALNAVAPAAVAPTLAMSLPADAAVVPDRPTLPAPAVVPPTQVIQAPASLTRASDRLSTEARSRAVLAAARANLPSPALAAYQRAATVINASDPGCGVSWEHIAAIGRVESDHGRYGGSHLDRNGIALPGILGIPLNGTHGTRTIRDTDAGLYDGDTRWDRAVGPMQFIPSTWSVVGVDADGDGTRNPQDVDDAALATAVYLCSGSDDLSTEAGRVAATLRYNHNNSYVALVLATADGYARGHFDPMTAHVVSASFSPDTFEVRLPPLPGSAHAARRAERQDRAKVLKAKAKANAAKGNRPPGSFTANVPDPATPTAPADPTGPAQPPAPEPGPTPAPEPAPAPAPEPTPEPEPAPEPTPEPEPAPEPPPAPEQPPAPAPPTRAEAEGTCAARGLVDDPDTDDDDFDACVADQLATKP